METTQSLYDELRTLEESLWKRETRFDVAYMDKIFAPDFFEFGRSGNIYTRQECMESQAQDIAAKFPLTDFRIHPLDATNVLVVYQSEVQCQQLERANRSSLWTLSSQGWQLRFHQGTPVL